MLSAIGHLLAAVYAFGVPILAADLAPLLLGAAAFAAGRAWQADHREAWTAMCMACLGAGLAASIASPPWLLDELTPDAWLTLTPMRWSLLAAAATLGYLAWRTQKVGWVIGIPLMIVPALLGPHPSDTAGVIASICRGIFRLADALIPRTVTGWGFLAMAFAFLVLMLGMLWSLLRPRRSPAE